MKLLLVLALTFTIYACGHENDFNPNYLDLDLGPKEITKICEVSCPDKAWHQGYHVAKNACENGVYGDIKLLCNKAIQRDCIHGIQAYLMDSPCRGVAKFNNLAIQKTLCPAK